MTQYDVTGPGFDQQPSVDPGSGDSTTYPSCRFSALQEIALVAGNRPQASERVIDIGLDRDSFTSRGWPEGLLGAWNNGALTGRRGIFLSMFYALQMGDPHDLSHPWNEPTTSWDRGLSAHIDYWTQQQRHLSYRLFVYDNYNPPTRRGVIVGRRGNEAPFFGGGPCAGAIGCAGGDDKIYVQSDFSWALGHRIDAPVWIQGPDGKWRMNISYVIAHEVGHFFGFPHVNDTGCIMNPQIGGDRHKRPLWQVPENQMNPLFANLARQVNG